jgi:Fe-S-cluster-containing dehydrogenase component
VNGTRDPADRRRFLRLLVQSAGSFAFVGCLADPEDGKPPPSPGGASYDWDRFYWAYAVDIDRCIGCGSCMRACRTENGVPEGFYRTWVERFEIPARGHAHVDIAAGRSAAFDRDALPPATERTKGFFVPKLCNHCVNSVCSQVCPVGASYSTKDGVVLVDHQRCVGCAYCVQACPYSTRFINPRTHLADKCTLCYHRITVGLPPACVLVCPTRARMYGNLKDSDDQLHEILQQRRHMLLKPELGTEPKCYYLGLDLEVV